MKGDHCPVCTIVAEVADGPVRADAIYITGMTFGYVFPHEVVEHLLCEKHLLVFRDSSENARKRLATLIALARAQPTTEG